jgi:uncharacterized membrane protein YccC
VRDWIVAYRRQLRFCVRTTVAGVSAFAIARSLNFPLHGLWAALTAVVVTQVSIGGSLRATIDYFIGSLGGAIYAAAIGVLIPHSTAPMLAFVLALAIAPMALAAAINPSFRVAPFSAALVLLIGGELGETPIVSAVVRLSEVVLGGAVAMAASILVFPERAHKLGLETAAQILTKMADLLCKLLSGFQQTLDSVEIAPIQDALGRSVLAFQALTDEAKRERIVSFARDPDPAPLSRTLVRLRNDLVILSRAAASPLPEAIAHRLGSQIASISAEASDFLGESATALTEKRGPPSLARVDAALSAFNSEVTALRSEGLTRALTTDEVERLFALGFALEQLFGHFADLAQRIQEYGPSEGRQNRS